MALDNGILRPSMIRIHALLLVYGTVIPVLGRFLGPRQR